MTPTLDTRFPTILSGAAAVQAAAGLKAAHDKAIAWPYDWIYAPKSSRNVYQEGFIVAPTQGVLSEVLAYKVPDSLQFVLTGIVLQIIGSTWLPGDFIWTIDANLPVGSLSAQGVAFTGFGAVQSTKGSDIYPWPIQSGEGDKLKANDTLRAKILNVNIVAGGSNFFKAIFVGYTMPRAGNR